MIAKFHIRSSFVFSARNYFAVIGDIIEGEVGNGMILLTDNDKTGNLIIDSVESVRGSLGSVGLVFKYNQREELDNLKDLEGKVVLIKAV
jgi:hypothetical protein